MKYETIAYHGSGTAIQSFSHDFIGQGRDQYGSGFYFTSSYEEAEGYCYRTIDGEDKPGGMLSPSVHTCRIKLNNPLKEDSEIIFDEKRVSKLLKYSPNLNEVLDNFGEVEFEGFKTVFSRAIESYVSDAPDPALEIFNMISNDFFNGDEGLFLEKVTEIFGYDGVIVDFGDGKNHIIAWHPEQIEILQITEPEDQCPVYGTYLYHGTSEDSANNIIENGIDINKCSHGYFGLGFYTASKFSLAKNNYADMSDDKGAVVQLKIKPSATILDTRNEHDWSKLSANKDNSSMHIYAFKNGIDGIYDRSFGGVVIYNPEAVEVVGLISMPEPSGMKLEP